MFTKICTVCLVEKSLDKFYNRKLAKDGKQSHCKGCDSVRSKKYKEAHRDTDHYRERTTSHNLKAKFGITIEDYNVLLKAQGNHCAICTATQGDKKGRAFCVDHDHKTGQIRGLLCFSCNRGLGLLGDTEDSIQKTLNYLQKDI